MSRHCCCVLIAVLTIFAAKISNAQVGPASRATTGASVTTAASAANPAFAFASGLPAYDQAYEKARRVIAANVKDGKFLAGQNWAQVWTRDTSYSTELACAILHPGVAKTTLLDLTQQVNGIGECWYQDRCGHFAGWPNLTDAIVGASGAWSLYLVTGDRDLLPPLYERTLRSLKRAERDAFNAKLGLFSGCSSFMESDSAYPRKYADNGGKLAKTCALSTCLLYYRGYLVAADAGELLNKDVQPLREKAARLKDAINARFWLPEKGYYGYYLDENGKIDDRMEGLGEAFAILTGVADADRARQILRSTPTTAWGFPCLWPQYPEWQSYQTDFAHYYHNGMIWPFVEGYWAWAASESKDAKTFGRELDALVALSGKNDTFMELYRPRTASRTAPRGSCGAARPSSPWFTTGCSASTSSKAGCGSRPSCRSDSNNSRSTNSRIALRRFKSSSRDTALPSTSSCSTANRRRGPSSRLPARAIARSKFC